MMKGDGWWEWWRRCSPPLGLLGEDRAQEPGVVRRYAEDEDLGAPRPCGEVTAWRLFWRPGSAQTMVGVSGACLEPRRSSAGGSGGGAVKECMFE